MVKQWRLLKHWDGNPAWNMAVDEALVILHSKGNKPPVLRLYTWEPPALSLGYFQQTARIRSDILERRGIVLVKRITGGRAVLHLGDLTYSLVARAGDDTPDRVLASYNYLCQGLLAAFNLLGIQAQLGSDKMDVSFSTSCFAVATPSDITWQGRKFVGSAQKRFGSSLLQHGSILVRPQGKLLSEIFVDEGKNKAQILTEKTVSLEDILGRQIALTEVANSLISGFQEALDIEFTMSELSDEERELAGSLIEKYRQVYFMNLNEKSHQTGRG